MATQGKNHADNAVPAPRIITFNSAVARSGSGWPQIADITATPCAPAAKSGMQLPPWIPPIATTGTPGCRDQFGEQLNASRLRCMKAWCRSGKTSDRYRGNRPPVALLQARRHSRWKGREFCPARSAAAFPSPADRPVRHTPSASIARAMSIWSLMMSGTPSGASTVLSSLAVSSHCFFFQPALAVADGSPFSTSQRSLNMLVGTAAQVGKVTYSSWRNPFF